MVIARLSQCVRTYLHAVSLTLLFALAPVIALAAPYAAIVMDARTGEILYESNADTRLHPASLTKMMTLYIAFEAIERGEITLDTKVRISAHAASQAPSKLGLKAGQRIALRYLIRAAAIKSANDAATAIGEAISGSESAFAKRMTRTAKAIGMTRTTFRNANGLTAEGHLSTAHDMTILGRRLFYDFPQYYNIFSRRTADAGVASVSSTNRRFLDSYEGADGIKTGFTNAAGFNLTASAHRGNKRIIATIFGGRSTASRNAKMAELLDIGFGKAPNRVNEQVPEAPVYMADAEEAPADDAMAAAVAQDVEIEDMTGNGTGKGAAAGKTIRVALAITKSPRPRQRPAAEEPAVAVAAAAPAETPVGSGEVVAQAETALPDTDAAVELALQEALGTPENAQADQLALAEAPAEPATPGFEQTTAPQPETLALAETPEVPATPVTLADAGTVSPLPRPDAGAADATEEILTATSEDEPEPVLTEPLPQIAVADEAVLSETAETDNRLALLAAPATTALPEAETAIAAKTVSPEPRPDDVALPEEAAEVIMLADAAPEASTEEALEVVTRVSTSGGRQWGISVGKYPSRYEAERILLQTALEEMSTLEEALRKVANRKGGYDALFVGMTEEMAELACLRLQARSTECTVFGPNG